jgi:hypothetical protein
MGFPASLEAELIARGLIPPARKRVMDWVFSKYDSADTYVRDSVEE